MSITLENKATNIILRVKKINIIQPKIVIKFAPWREKRYYQRPYLKNNHRFLLSLNGDKALRGKIKFTNGYMSP
jgi:hypothetical protein